MSKTEVILTENVVGLGAESDKVEVAAGYARNYLLPLGKAISASAGNERYLAALQTR
ncbi:MAG: bL9 family ribosomal protein, partial [Verrucomicrobiota bacterium]|nr:bL9 family ribosomal protein [Verrucomicrobiota bacterium]